MTWSFVAEAHSSAYDTAGTNTISTPTGTQAGDLLVCGLMNYGTGHQWHGVPGNINGSAARPWTPVYPNTDFGSGSSPYPLGTAGWFYRIAESGDLGQTHIFTRDDANNNFHGGIICAYRNAVPLQPTLGQWVRDANNSAVSGHSNVTGNSFALKSGFSEFLVMEMFFAIDFHSATDPTLVSSGDDLNVRGSDTATDGSFKGFLILGDRDISANTAPAFGSGTTYWDQTTAVALTTIHMSIADMATPGEAGGTDAWAWIG